MYMPGGAERVDAMDEDELCTPVRDAPLLGGRDECHESVVATDRVLASVGDACMCCC